MKTLILSIVIVGSALFISAFKAPQKPITELKDLKKVLKDGYSFVPSGRILLESDTVSVQGFFMMKGEVSNFDYKEFLMYLKSNNRMMEYYAALPDSTQWEKHQLTPFKNTYFSHPVYRTYPVVNITKKQAQAYCDFLTEVWQKNTNNKKIKFRLPLKAEFLRASYGEDLHRTYPWKGEYLRDGKGCYMSNFATVSSEDISRNQKSGKLEVVKDKQPNYKEGAMFTASVISYSPNEWGLYNLSGNVSEMIADGPVALGGNWNSPGYDVRCESAIPFNDANPYVGFRPVMTYVK